MARRTEAHAEPSPLRLARNWTLEDVVEQVDRRSPGGHSGVTPSMVSSWERGRHTTSIGHRKTLCEIYRLPPETLFAHQDAGLGQRAAPRLLADCRNQQQAMSATVAGATGSATCRPRGRPSSLARSPAWWAASSTSRSTRGRCWCR